jgi:hypothetical protein
MATQTRPQPTQGPAHTRNGWVTFAGVYLILAGTLLLIWGIVALSKKSYFVEEGLLWSKLSVWGAAAVIVGPAQIIGGLLIYAQRMGGLILGLVLAMCGILLNFVTIGAYPLWSCIGIVANALVLWAVTVHGEQEV